MATHPTIVLFLTFFGVFTVLGHKLDKMEIVNGNDSITSTIPYQVYLKFEDSKEQWYCGGTLISPNYVLTAGYCTLERDGVGQKVTVYLGANNVSASGENGRIEMCSTQIITHESLRNRQRATGNIGLVKLPHTVAFTESIQPISLGSRNRSNTSLVNITGVISGWGSTDGMSYTEPEMLHVANIVIVDNANCSSVAFFDKYSQLCGANTDDLNTGICDRDIGGPLVVNNTQVGIIFISDPVCDIDSPQLFIKVSYYFDWIEDNSDIVID